MQSCDLVVIFPCMQDALRAMQVVIRTVDNAIIVANLRGFPKALETSHMIRAEPFTMYTTQKKKRIREAVVILHRDYIIFTQPHQGDQEGVEFTTYEYLESLQVCMWLSVCGCVGGWEHVWERDHRTHTSFFSFKVNFPPMQTSKVDLLETYKGRKDKFAICEGPAKAASKFYVLQVSWNPAQLIPRPSASFDEY